MWWQVRKHYSHDPACKVPRWIIYMKTRGEGSETEFYCCKTDSIFNRRSRAKSTGNVVKHPNSEATLWVTNRTTSCPRLDFSAAKFHWTVYMPSLSIRTKLCDTLIKTFLSSVYLHNPLVSLLVISDTKLYWYFCSKQECLYQHFVMPV